MAQTGVSTSVSRFFALSAATCSRVYAAAFRSASSYVILVHLLRNHPDTAERKHNRESKASSQSSTETGVVVPLHNPINSQRPAIVHLTPTQLKLLELVQRSFDLLPIGAGLPPVDPVPALHQKFLLRPFGF